MNKEEIRDWVLTNFKVVRDDKYSSLIYDLIPKTELGKMLDDDYRNWKPRDGHGNFFTKDGDSSGLITVFLVKFYNVDRDNVHQVFIDLTKQYEQRGNN
jgi:hypothetical protein